MEDLVVIGHIRCLSLIVELVQDLIKVSWSIKVDSLERIAIVLDGFLNTVDSWVENVSVQGEAMGCLIRYRWDVTSKAIQIDHFVSVVELEDVTNVLDDGKIGISPRV